MSEEVEILQQVLNAINLLREEIAGERKPTMTTQEVCDYLGISDTRILGKFCQRGLLTRYGNTRTGYRYCKKDVYSLQEKLFTGEVKLPKRLETAA